jgi:uncharacterized protein (TIGR00369 family)
VTLGGYPPAKHILGDLGIETEVSTVSTARARLRANPYLAGPDGGVRAGVLATLVDVVGGAVAVRSVLPDWMATADLTLQLVGPAVGPWVEARATIVRRGRTTLVIEAVVSNVDDDGSEAAGPVGWASMTFTILPGRSATTTIPSPAPPPVRWAFSGEGLVSPIADALSIDLIDPAVGELSMPALEYAANSFGAVQGGVMALLAEVAGAEALGAHQGPGGGAVVVTELLVTYLALGRVGPIESRCVVLDPGGGNRPHHAVVELADAGADGRVTTVVTVRGAPHPTVASAAGARVPAGG